ncbi:MAG: hypothetical protein RLZZ124_93 [Cyanobacteriota bacterium]|jgi:hypothetical protein
MPSHDRSGLPLGLLALLLPAGLAAAALLQPPELPGAWLSALQPPQPQLLPQDYPLDTGREAVLFSQLDAGDRGWRPWAEPLPGGGIRYHYKRRSGEPPLNLEQIKALIRHPPSFTAERQAIATLLGDLRRVGVRVVLGPPRKQGAAGEWEPRRTVLRIRPDVPAKGSREFARVLNHEAIHVAQSCRRGRIHARPQPLGLSRSVDPHERRNLEAPLYAGASPLERALEEEAYANQHRLSLGSQLLQAHCRRA